MSSWSVDLFVCNVTCCRIQFNSEEQWTKALKFLLTNLKWGLAWVSSQFANKWYSALLYIISCKLLITYRIQVKSVVIVENLFCTHRWFGKSQAQYHWKFIKLNVECFVNKRRLLGILMNESVWCVVIVDIESSCVNTIWLIEISELLWFLNVCTHCCHRLL